MNTIEIVMTVLAALCFAYTTMQVVKAIRLRKFTGVAEATVEKVKETHPGKKKGHAWGEVSYRVDGTNYRPKQMIDLIPGVSVGDKVKVMYFLDNPEKLLNSPLRTALIVLMLGLLFAVIGLYF